MTSKELVTRIIKEKYRLKDQGELYLLLSPEASELLMSAGVMCQWAENNPGSYIQWHTICGLQYIDCISPKNSDFKVLAADETVKRLDEFYGRN